MLHFYCGRAHSHTKGQCKSCAKLVPPCPKLPHSFKIPRKFGY